MSALNRSQSDITAYDGTPVRLVILPHTGYGAAMRFNASSTS